jgi:hypothetical protein
MDTIIVHKVTSDVAQDEGRLSLEMFNSAKQPTNIQDQNHSEPTDTQQPHNDSNGRDKDVATTDNSRKCGGKKRWILIAIVVVVIVAILAGVLGGSSSTRASLGLPTRAVPPTQAPTYFPSEAPSEAPSQAPTTLRSKVEGILSDYEPLDEQTLVWLLETSTWEPEEGDPNSDYLWLERYVMALLYFSTNGPNWPINNNNWLSDEAACTWFSLETTQECPGPVTGLVLSKLLLVRELYALYGQNAAKRQADN